MEFLDFSTIKAFFFFISVQLLCNVVLVFAVPQNDSALCIHISPFLFFGFFFSHLEG